LERLACSIAIIHGRLSLGIKEDFQVAALQCRIQMTKSGLYCPKVNFNIPSRVGGILDIIDALQKKLDTLSSCSGDAHGRAGNTETIGHRWTDLQD